MKELVKMSRLTGALEKLFRMLNKDFFNDTLPMPIITVIPTTKAYAHYVPYDVWNANGEGKREINISSAYLDRPLENVLASLLHEMVHMHNDIILNEQDTSRGGTYHNKVFKREAELHGLTVSRDEKYGWTITEPGEALIDWILNQDLREIELCRDVPSTFSFGVGKFSGDGGTGITVATGKSNSRKYVCPCCKTSVRATKVVHVVCGDCMETMIEV